MSKNTFHSAAGLGEYGEHKSVTFNGTTGAGEAGEIDLFTVTGGVIIRLACICTTSLTSGAGATVEVGISGSTAAFIAQTTAVDIDGGEIWHDATPDAEIEATTVMADYILGNGNDIILTVATDNVSTGVLQFQAWWTPITSGASVVVA